MSVIRTLAVVPGGLVASATAGPVALSDLATISAGILGNPGPGAAIPASLTAAQVMALLGLGGFTGTIGHA